MVSIKAGSLLKLADRTAVLAVGVAAGFAIGLAFHTSEPQVAAGPAIASAAPPTVIPAQAGTPELTNPIDRRVVKRVAADGRIRVGVFGDSFGIGIWDALYHQLPADKGFDVLKFGKEATGFTRYRRLDLEQQARQQLRNQPIDVAVMSFGANDVQPIFAENHLQLLMSGGWKRIIGERIDRFVTTARSTGATVYWVGLPIMRDPAMDQQLVEMDAFYAERMRRLGVPFIDTRAASADAAGKFSTHLPDTVSGKPLLMRANDGLHMTGIGYQRLTTPLAARIRAFAALARQEAGVPAPAPTATASVAR